MSETIILSAYGFEAELWPQGANLVRLVHKADGIETPLL